MKFSTGGPGEDHHYARADYLFLNAAFGLFTEDHPLAGYWADLDKARAALQIDRFGMRADTVFKAK